MVWLQIRMREWNGNQWDSGLMIDGALNLLFFFYIYIECFVWFRLILAEYFHTSVISMWIIFKCMALIALPMSYK